MDETRAWRDSLVELVNTLPHLSIYFASPADDRGNPPAPWLERVYMIGPNGAWLR